jgi:hypothetical protein
MAPQVGLEPTTLRLTGGEQPSSADYCRCISMSQISALHAFQDDPTKLPIATIFCLRSPVFSPVPLLASVGFTIVVRSVTVQAWGGY